MIRKGGVPTYLYPEDAAQRPGAGGAPRRLEGDVPTEEPPELRRRARRTSAAAVIAEALEDGAGVARLRADRASCSTAIGIRARRVAVADDPPAPAEAAAELGGRVALKALGPEIVHKTDLGAVRIGLPGRQQVADARGRGDRRGAGVAPA